VRPAWVQSNKPEGASLYYLGSGALSSLFFALAFNNISLAIKDKK
jgi:hypothetical protein